MPSINGFPDLPIVWSTDPVYLLEARFFSVDKGKCGEASTDFCGFGRPLWSPGSWDSVVGVEIRQLIGRSGVRIPTEARICFLVKNVVWLRVPPSLLHKGYPSSFAGGKAV